MNGFLTEAVLPFFEKKIWNNSPSAFYIQYVDEGGAHIRLRLEGDTWKEVVEEHFSSMCTKIKEVDYQPETARYGGEEGLILCEEHFHLSTTVCLTRLARHQGADDPYTQALFDALRLNVSLGAAAGLSKKEIADYFGRLRRQWFSMYFRSPEGNVPDAELEEKIVQLFEDSFQAQEVTLRESLDAIWMTLADQDFEAAEPEWRLWYKRSKTIFDALGKNLSPVLPSLLHLTNNRLGIRNQDEVFLCYLLERGL